MKTRKGVLTKNKSAGTLILAFPAAITEKRPWFKPSSLLYFVMSAQAKTDDICLTHFSISKINIAIIMEPWLCATKPPALRKLARDREKRKHLSLKGNRQRRELASDRFFHRLCKRKREKNTHRNRAEEPRSERPTMITRLGLRRAGIWTLLCPCHVFCAAEKTLSLRGQEASLPFTDYY